jgi:hypothetical protein
MMIAAYIVISMLVIANVAVTLSIWRADEYTRNQRFAQAAVVWLLPFVGSAVVYGVLRSSREKIQLRSSHFPETNTEGEYAGQSHGAAHDP